MRRDVLILTRLWLKNFKIFVILRVRLVKIDYFCIYEISTLYF